MLTLLLSAQDAAPAPACMEAGRGEGRTRRLLSNSSFSSGGSATETRVAQGSESLEALATGFLSTSVEVPDTTDSRHASTLPVVSAMAGSFLRQKDFTSSSHTLEIAESARHTRSDMWAAREVCTGADDE